MIEKDGCIIEATETELFKKYMNEGYDDFMSFKEYLYKMKSLGVIVNEG